MNKTLLGTGLLSWPNVERIAGRFGIIYLFDPEKGADHAVPLQIDGLTDQRGSFVAVMNGQEYDLGSGTFFTEQHYGHTYVGLKPDVPREEDWLNVDNLYKVDWQLSKYTPVDLYFTQE